MNDSLYSCLASGTSLFSIRESLPSKLLYLYKKKTTKSPYNPALIIGGDLKILYLRKLPIRTINLLQVLFNWQRVTKGHQVFAGLADYGSEFVAGTHGKGIDFIGNVGLLG